jgi:hypothetical protein
MFLFLSFFFYYKIRMSDVIECMPGAEIKVDPSEQHLLLTIIAKEILGSRVLVLKFAGREERNSMLSRLR